MRRIGLVLACLGLGLAASGCDDDDAARVAPTTVGTTTVRNGDEIPVKIAERVEPEKVGLEQCRPADAIGGGYDVWIRNIRCDEVRKILPLLGASVSDKSKGARPGVLNSREGVFEHGGGWACWGRLEGSGGPIHSVCFRGDQLVFYYFG